MTRWFTHDWANAGQSKNPSKQIGIWTADLGSGHLSKRPQNEMYSFPKNLRLLSSPEFRRVLDHGAKAVRPEIVIFCMPSKNSSGSRRLGLIVSKKVGNSVERNLVKRRLREIFRQDTLPVDTLDSSPLLEVKSLDIVIIARERASRATSAQLFIAWQNGLKRAQEAWNIKSTTKRVEGAVVDAS